MWNGGNRRPDRDEIDPVQSAIAAYTGRGGGYGHGPSYTSSEAVRSQPYQHHYHEEEDPYHRRYHHQERPRAWSGDQGRTSSYQYPHHQRERGGSDEYDDPRSGHATSWGSSAAASARGSGANERQHGRNDDGYDSSPQDDDEEETAYYADRERKHAAEEEEDDNGSSREPSPVPQATAAVAAPSQPRGKPESMAAKLASAARVQEKLDELEAEGEEVVAEPLDEAMEEAATPASVTAAAVVEEVTAEPTKSKESKPAAAPETPKSTTKKRKRKSPSNSSKKAKTTAAVVISTNAPSMDDPAPKIKDAEYENLEALMIQFCRVPLLAEFSRPVSLLHPELMGVYSKIVDHPIDLGKVCRGIRRREYDSLREVRIDAWRIFANCVKYHSHPTNKDAVPSFVSIALHLRDYFNSLWQEHMLPSDPPRSTGKQQKTGPAAQLRAAFTKRAEERKKRSTVSGLTVMTPKCLERAAQALDEFLEEGGCVDKLDTVHLFGERCQDEEEDVDIVVTRLHKVLLKLRQLAANEEEYSIEEFESEIRRCYTEDIFEFNPSIRARLSNRLDRLVGKIVVPVYEANCRGVTQSSIWGCMAAAVWARESSKKPFWPALVLGIMAPEDQREDWHFALTDRNELRLPEKLRAQLLSGKRKAELALKRQSLGQLEPQSYFLVEFLGTHEFIWVKESDMVENFDPTDDPNQHSVTVGGKKKRAGGRNSNVVGSKMYASGVEEGKWALEEFELQLQDTCGDPPDDEDDGEEMNYSYSLLCQSDDEADEEIQRKSVADGVLDVEECNELLATEGLLDFSVEGRKNAKKRAMALKKMKAEAEKKMKADKLKKQKAELVKKKKDAKSKERETKKEQRDLEKRRKKRIREREKAIKSSTTKAKKARKSASQTPADLKKAPSGRRNVIACKRGRAQAIVDGYLARVKENADYKSLALGGVMTIPASLVDSSGLLGMTLAFRAAAGEIPMPEESGTQQDPKPKPWDAIDVDGQTTTAGKISSLEKQVTLLEKEVARVKDGTRRRKQLLAEALNTRQERDDRITKEDSLARQNPFKKRKKVEPTPDKKTSLKGKVTPNEDELETKEDAEGSGEIVAEESPENEAASNDAEEDHEGATESVAGGEGENVADEAMDDSYDGPDDKPVEEVAAGKSGTVDAVTEEVDDVEPVVEESTLKTAIETDAAVEDADTEGAAAKTTDGDAEMADA